MKKVGMVIRPHLKRKLAEWQVSRFTDIMNNSKRRQVNTGEITLMMKNDEKCRVVCTHADCPGDEFAVRTVSTTMTYGEKTRWRRQHEWKMSACLYFF